MEENFSPAIVFGACLRSNDEAAQFYDACSSQQRQAILCQLQKLRSTQEVEQFVDHLPSAAL